MKRVMAFILSVATILSLMGCEKSPDNSQSSYDPQEVYALVLSSAVIGEKIFSRLTKSGQ